MFNFDPPEVTWFTKPLMGEAETTISNDRLGRVSFRGTSWFARLDDPSFYTILQAGELVMVLGQEGCTTLIVMPVGDVSRQPKPDRSQTKREERKNGWFQWSRLAS